MTEWTLVTGAARGLGSAICLELAKKGHSVVIHYRSSLAQAEALREQCMQLGVRAEIIQGDYASQEGVAAFITEYLERFSATKNLVNNVGNYQIACGLDTPLADWMALYQTNFFSALALMQALSETIRFFNGSIVNIGVAGIQSVPADVYATAYTSSKLALFMATKSLAKLGLRANMVSPGYLENAVDLPAKLKGVSLKEAAQLVAFLLDVTNSSITGQNIEIANGVRL